MSLGGARAHAYKGSTHLDVGVFTRFTYVLRAERILRENLRSLNLYKKRRIRSSEKAKKSTEIEKSRASLFRLSKNLVKRWSFPSDRQRSEEIKLNYG